MSGTYDWTTSDDVFGEWTALDESFCLEQSRISPPIDVYLVQTTMSYYNSLSTNGASPLCEWIDDRAPHDLVNCWIQLHVPNGRIPNRRVPSKDVFIPFIVYGYDDGCHLIESFHFKSERTKVDLTRLYAPCIRYQGGRKFLSEIRPLSDIVKEDTEFERTALSFHLRECSILEHINKIDVKTTLDFYNSLSKNNTSPWCEWVDDPHDLVNCWIQLRVPNSDIFLMFTVKGYNDGFHLIESFSFKSLSSVVDLTLLPSGSIRQPDDRVFLSEILPQSDIVKEVSDENKRSDIVKEVSDENKRSGIVKEDLVKDADEITEAQHLDNVTKDLVKEAADAQTDIVEEDSVKEHADEIKQANIDIVTKDVVKHADEVTEAYLDRIRRRYIADMYKKKDEMAEVLRKLTLETQQRDWEKQQKENKEQRKLKTALDKSKKEEQKKKKK